MPRKKPNAWASTSFSNYLFEMAQSESEEEHHATHRHIMEFHGAHRRFPDQTTGKIPSCVEFAKSVLGRQDYTWTGSYRNWVWERGDWRLYVNNTQGFSFEVREGLSLEGAKAAWDEIRALFAKGPS